MTPLPRILTQQRQTVFRLLTSRSSTAAAATTSSLRSSAGAIRFLSGDSITYSGGQATEGQGGYYGSGGARVGADTTNQGTEDRRAVLAMASDVQKITAVMDELDMLESLLRREEEEQKAKKSSPDKTVTPKLIELKASIKKLMTAPDFVETLNRLEIQGEPVWGLSTDEREMIVLAREKVNEC